MSLDQGRASGCGGERSDIGDRARVLELRRETTEPRRDQKQLVDLVRRDLARYRLGDTEHVGDRAYQSSSVRYGARTRVFGANASAPDQIDPVIAVEARDRVCERQCLDSEAQTRKLPAQRLQSLQLVAKRGCALELQSLARGFHVASKHLDRSVVGSIEKSARQDNPLPVLLHGTAAHAGTEAFLHLEANTPGSA